MNDEEWVYLAKKYGNANKIMNKKTYVTFDFTLLSGRNLIDNYVKKSQPDT